MYWDQPVTQEEFPGKFSRQLPSPTPHPQCAKVSSTGTPPHTLPKKGASLWLRVYWISSQGHPKISQETHKNVHTHLVSSGWKLPWLRYLRPNNESIKQWMCLARFCSSVRGGVAPHGPRAHAGWEAASPAHRKRSRATGVQVTFWLCLWGRPWDFSEL